jgi:hypothetical protein
MKVYVARSCGHKITKRWCMIRNDDHGGDAHKMMDMMFMWRRRI